MSLGLNEYLKQHSESLSPLLIMTHDHPDPDAMASAFALHLLASELYGIRSRIVYGGEIGRMENQTMKRELKIPIRPLRARDLQGEISVALVDTQPPFSNNRFPPERKADIVIDHHPRNRHTQADFSLIREAYGATSTILVQALQEVSFRFSRPLATALVYGISSETQNLGREASPEDISAYMHLYPQISTASLAKIQHPPRSDDFFTTVGVAIGNAFVCGRVIGVHLGRIQTPDLVSQIADFLLSCHGKTWSLCTGRYRGRLHISLRTSNVKAEAGRMLQRLVGVKGAAGGHDMIAGGAVTMGERATEEEWLQLEAGLATRLMQRLGYKREAPFDKAFPTE